MASGVHSCCLNISGSWSPSVQQLVLSHACLGKEDKFLSQRKPLYIFIFVRIFGFVRRGHILGLGMRKDRHLSTREDLAKLQTKFQADRLSLGKTHRFVRIKTGDFRPTFHNGNFSSIEGKRQHPEQETEISFYVLPPPKKITCSLRNNQFWLPFVLCKHFTTAVQRQDWAEKEAKQQGLSWGIYDGRKMAWITWSLFFSFFF